LGCLCNGRRRLCICRHRGCCFVVVVAVSAVFALWLSVHWKFVWCGHHSAAPPFGLAYWWACGLPLCWPSRYLAFGTPCGLWSSWFSVASALSRLLCCYLKSKSCGLNSNHCSCRGSCLVCGLRLGWLCLSCCSFCLGCISPALVVCALVVVVSPWLSLQQSSPPL